MALAGDQNLSVFCVNWCPPPAPLLSRNAFCNRDMFIKMHCLNQGFEVSYFSIQFV